jgi:hypothetical protein
MLNKVLDYIGTPRMAVLAAGVYALILLLAATCQGRPPQCTLPERSQLTNVWVVDSERHYGSVTDLPARPPQRSTTNATGKGSNGNGDHTLSSRKKAVRRGCACSGGCTCGCNEGAPCTCGQATGVNVSRAFLGVPTAPLASLAPVQPQPLQACCTSSCENMPYRVAGTGRRRGPPHPPGTVCYSVGSLRPSPRYELESRPRLPACTGHDGGRGRLRF